LIPVGAGAERGDARGWGERPGAKPKGVAGLVVIPELLPRRARATGMAIAYAIGVSMFGGTTQFIITYLIGATGDPTSPAWYVTLTSVITAFTMWALPESRGRSLAG
jgi:Sugar (and other) transporter